jgi:uncharacterized protein with von Willebrand factor type A (vWA) domain
MDIKQMQEDKYFIVLQALLQGIRLEFKNRKSLFYYNNFIYESYYNKAKGKQITHKSKVSLESFIKYFQKIDSKALKRIYGDIKLYKLAKKLNGKLANE